MAAETDSDFPSGLNAPSPLASVERAAFELRCGRPVFVLDGTDQAAAVIATEMANETRIEGLAALGDDAMPHVVLTHHRAETLKIRLYTPEIVRIPYPDWLTARQIRQLADPQYDLADPMRGPFLAEREKVGDAVKYSVKLAKIARILPSVLAKTVPSVLVGRASGDCRRQRGRYRSL